MARDADPDKSSKRRWGRGGKPEEGPSDEEMGWLADLRGARDDRSPIEEPTGRGRRGATPPDDPAGGVRGRRGATPPEDPTGSVRGRRLSPDDPTGGVRSRRGADGGGSIMPAATPAPDAVAPPSGRRRSEPPPSPSLPPPAQAGSDSRGRRGSRDLAPPPPVSLSPAPSDDPPTGRGLRRSPTPPPAAAPGAGRGAPPTGSLSSPAVASRPGRGSGARPDGRDAGRIPEPTAWSDETADVPRVREDPGSRTGDVRGTEPRKSLWRGGRNPTSTPPASRAPASPPLGGVPMAGLGAPAGAPSAVGPPSAAGAPPLGAPPKGPGKGAPPIGAPGGPGGLPPAKGPSVRPGKPGPGGPGVRDLGPNGPGPNGPGLGGPGPGGPGPGGSGLGAGLPMAVGPEGRPIDPMVTTGMIRRAEIRKHLKVAQQLKVGTLVMVALLLLAAYPVYLFTRSVTSDPVFGELDSLDLPGWASIQHEDAASGSRWCIGQCRFRERTWASERKAEETAVAYDTALRDAGWRPRTEGVCPAVQEGNASCWERDEYVMDMWVRVPICDIPPPRPTSATAAAGATTAPDPNATAAASCPGSLVTVKVFNAIDYNPVG